MGFFDGLKNGSSIFGNSIRVLFEKPVFLVPIFFSWFVFASVVLYLRYSSHFPSSFILVLLYLYLLLFLITFVISIANLVMLELMQQIESGKKTSLSDAFEEAISNDFFKVIPIAAIWAAIWVLILIIRALTSKKKGKSRAEPSARDAARTLAGANNPFSWIRLGLNMFEKLVRMTVFLALPAIAWEDKGPFSSFGKAFKIIKQHPVEFFTGYTMTGIAAVIMVLPLIPIFWLDDAGVAFSAGFWTAVIIYECVVWTLGIYLEQMSTGLLYLWHMNWEKKGSKGDLSSVAKPDLLDEIFELKQ